jgi:predicted AAA+ superfamily ATPase
LFKNGQRIGVQFKRADAPRITTSMHIVLQDLKLDTRYVVYPGLHRYKLADKVEAAPLWALLPKAVGAGLEAGAVR